METEFGNGQETGDNGKLVAKSAARKALGKMDGDRVDFCHVFVSTKFDYEVVLNQIREIIGDEAKLLGSSSAGEFTEDGVSAGTVTVALVASDTLKFYTGLATGLSEDVQQCVFDTVSELPDEDDPELEEYPYRAAINLHDGLSGIGNKVARLSKQYLGDVQLAGGAAGDDLKLEETHVFCGDRIETDAVGMALIASRKPIPMTVNHGHEAISQPMEVTHAQGSTVYEFDGKKAFDVWKDAIRESAQEIYDIDVDELEDDSSDLSMMLTRYEFGIETQPDFGEQEVDSGGLLQKIKGFLQKGMVSTSGYNIRWPGLTKTTDGPLEFAVQVPEKTELRVMHSSPNDQIESVRKAGKNAMRKAGKTEMAGGFIYDCICRGTILDDDFDDAIEAVSEEIEVPFTGFETYGEICTESDEYTSFHNTTSVVMLLPK